MAEHANSTTVPSAHFPASRQVPNAPLSIWRIRGLLEFTRASTIAVESDDAVEALGAIEWQLWRRLAAAPIKSRNDASDKLEVILEELIARRAIDHISVGVLRDVITWLDGAELS